MKHFRIATVAEQSAEFRRVLWTGENSQLVIMTVPPGGEIGDEVHEGIDQILSFVSPAASATTAVFALVLEANPDDVGVREVVPLEQQGFVPALRECVGEAVAEVELCRVAAAPAEVPVGRPGHLHLLGRDRLQDEGEDRRSG